MCTTAMDQDRYPEDRSSTKILIGAVVFGVVVSFLQNMEMMPYMVDFTAWMPVEGMSLQILIMPLVLGMGYVLGAKNALRMMAANLVVCLIEGPVGTAKGWFVNPSRRLFRGDSRISICQLR